LLSTSDILCCEELTKRFDGVLALDAVNFEAQRGEIHAIVGENGAGKSTLMKILSGIHQPNAGKIFFEGNEIILPTPLAAQHLGISTVHQEAHLARNMTIAENIFLGRERTKGFEIVDFDFLNTEAEKILQQLDVHLAPDTPVEELSAAEIQMVQIARGLSFSSKVLILDEPTAAITEHETDVLFALLRKLQRDGITILYVSHRIAEIFVLCQRATVLRDGRYIGTVNINESSEEEQNEDEEIEYE
jgi:ABC-type sugar transport system ATPase subunit